MPTNTNIRKDDCPHCNQPIAVNADADDSLTFPCPHCGKQVAFLTPEERYYSFLDSMITDMEQRDRELVASLIRSRKTHWFLYVILIMGCFAAPLFCIPLTILAIIRDVRCERRARKVEASNLCPILTE